MPWIVLGKSMTNTNVLPIWNYPNEIDHVACGRCIDGLKASRKENASHHFQISKFHQKWARPWQQKIKFVNISCSNLTFLQGGLTTPNCNEAVLWTNMKSTQTISEAQLAVFRSMTDSDGTSLNNNYRPPLPLNNRTIYTTGVSKFSKDCCFIITSSIYTAW